MTRPRSSFTNALLLVLAFAVALGAVFRSRVQAWEAGLPQAEFNGVKLLIAASVAIFIVTVIGLTLARNRKRATAPRPDA